MVPDVFVGANLEKEAVDWLSVFPCVFVLLLGTLLNMTHGP